MRKFWLGYWFKIEIPIQNWLLHCNCGSRTYFKNFKYLVKKNSKNAGVYAVNHQMLF